MRWSGGPPGFNQRVRVLADLTEPDAKITREMRIAPPEPITDDHMDQAVERLIVEQATHLDSLTARLHEPRVSGLSSR